MLIGLQYLRGVAALMVVYFHAVGPVERLTGVALPVSISASGVDLFFVLSGCVMWLSTHGRAVGPGQFLLNRLVRVAPLYWILTLLVAGLALALPALLRSTAFDPAHLAASLLFLPWPNPRYPGLFPVIIPGWTLNYEMFFYAVFALGLGRGRARTVAWTATLFALLILAGAAFRLPTPLAFWSDPIVLEFLLGAALGLAHGGGLRLGAGARLALGLAGIAGFAAFASIEPAGLARPLLAGLPAAMLVAAAALGRTGAQPPLHPLVLLGDASYALYLVHPFALRAVREAASRLGLAPYLGGIGIGALMLGGSAAAAILIYRLVERPLTRRLRGLLDRTGPATRAKTV